MNTTEKIKFILSQNLPADKKEGIKKLKERYDAVADKDGKEAADKRFSPLIDPVYTKLKAVEAQYQKDKEKEKEAKKKAEKPAYKPSKPTSKPTKPSKPSTPDADDEKKERVKAIIAKMISDPRYKALRGSTDIPRDSARQALPAGRRVSKNGNVYYETRKNESDVSQGGDYPMLKKGGVLTTKATYVPNRNIETLTLTLQNKLQTIKGKDILDGVYVKKKLSAAKSNSKNAIEIYNEIVSDYLAQGNNKKNLGITATQVSSLLSAGFDKRDIMVLCFGVSKAGIAIKADLEDTADGILTLEKKYQKEYFEKAIEFANKDTYAIGLKYPDFDWSKIADKYSIDTLNEIKTVENAEAYNEDISLSYGKKIVIGQTKSYQWKGESKSETLDYVGEVNFKNQTERQKYIEVKAGFNGGYWGIVTSDKNILYDVIKMLLQQKNAYCKNIHVFYNSLGGLSPSEAIKMSLQYADGGKIQNSENLYNVTGVRDGKRVVINANPTLIDEAHDIMHDAIRSKVYDDVRLQSTVGDKVYAHGGMVSHGLKAGDKIVKKGKGTTIHFYNKSKHESGVINLETGERVAAKYADGGEVTKEEKFMVYPLEEFVWLRKDPNDTSVTTDTLIESYPLSPAKVKMAKGGIVEAIKTKLDKSFALPYEMAVYVPSTTGADKKISAKEFKERISEVETYLGNLFGGFSKVDVDGGYVSDEKGLITENVARVTTFAKKENFETNLEKLISQISVWCDKWGQESMGYEFEGDLFYIEKGFKFAKGGIVTFKQMFNKKYGYDKDQSHTLEEISEKTGVSLEGLQQIYNKGIGAYKTNPESVRPNVKSKEQWAMARVYSAVMGGKTSRVDAHELKMANGGYIDPYVKWEMKVIREIEKLLDVTTSDAQAIIEGQDYYLMQSWDAGLTPSKAAKLIDEKSRVSDKEFADGGIVGDEVKFKAGHGYWDVTKYPYGGDFKRFKGGEKGHVIKGTVKVAGEMRVKLDDNRTIVVQHNALDMTDYEQKSDFYEKNKHLWSRGFDSGGEVKSIPIEQFFAVQSNETVVEPTERMKHGGMVRRGHNGIFNFVVNTVSLDDKGNIHLGKPTTAYSLSDAMMRVALKEGFVDKNTAIVVFSKDNIQYVKGTRNFPEEKVREKLNEYIEKHHS